MGADICAQEKKVVFDDMGGRFTYETDSALFMSFLEMIPGEIYTESLYIENKSRTAEVDLYFKILPETEEKDGAILDYIFMKIYDGNTPLYDGTAAGQSYEAGYGKSRRKNSRTNLNGQIYLGTYRPGEGRTLSAEVMFSREVPEKYAGITGKNELEFTAVKKERDGEEIIVVPSSVKTGEQNRLWFYIPAAAGSALLIYDTVMKMYKTYKNRVDTVAGT